MHLIPDISRWKVVRSLLKNPPQNEASKELGWPAKWGFSLHAERMKVPVNAGHSKDKSSLLNSATWYEQSQELLLPPEQ